MSLQDAKERCPIPSYIPPGLLDRRSDVPHFGKDVRPSRLTINVFKLARDLFHTEDCIDQLPFPNNIRELTIKLNAYPHWQQLRYSTLEDLKNLCYVIQPLHHDGGLKQLKLDILTESWPCPADTTKEISKVQEAFAPLLKRGGFALDICVGPS
ncbi:hypothetical protein BDN71DRAFT_1506386 [Pleurotus eryngii]|uniref:Uncharacterized protein n=1 Tax=Pleurotus eryngii TaxID=5323 RepID=A0A9P5ZY78_PLEER|nr:hypothetical protein BDN71DRAFT_1506386 [Pleurotus eryngii]